MSDLSGNLAAFGLRRVLQLLRDAGTSGEMLVAGDEVKGRVLLREGRIAYATTASGSDTVAELDSLLRSYESEGADEGLRSLEDVLLEKLADVTHELIALPAGVFEVVESSVDHDEEVYSFPVDDVLELVDARIQEWNAIRELIPSDEAVLRLVSRLPDESSDVTFDAATWSLLAAIGGGASMAEVVTSLGTKQIPTARGLVGLIERGLIEVDTDPVDTAVEPAVELMMEAEPELPRLEPAEDPVTFSSEDLSRDEIDDVIRNIGRGIFPG
ncbi:MAG: DUF4388 domain-containing protein [Acidimicrobiia bacterium]